MQGSNNGNRFTSRITGFSGNALSDVIVIGRKTNVPLLRSTKASRGTTDEILRAQMGMATLTSYPTVQIADALCGKSMGASNVCERTSPVGTSAVDSTDHDA